MVLIIPAPIATLVRRQPQSRLAAVQRFHVCQWLVQRASVATAATPAALPTSLAPLPYPTPSPILSPRRLLVLWIHRLLQFQLR